MATTLDELDFKMVLDDKKFNDQIKKDLDMAQRLNTNLSNLLKAKVQLNNISGADVVNSRRAAQIEADRVKYLEQANRERLKTQAMQNRLDSATASHTSALKGMKGITGELMSMATKYLSIWGAKELVSNIIRVTGEFEMQRTTLSAMLKDAREAERIYASIQKLAVVSPFQFKDLMSYTKQLAAYSIPVKELYSTTKMLADVSAGLGVGMDRLVLAYGQIRSASFLRGQEVRQLTEAGIPILEELRKQFEALGEEGITAADVFDKISKRLVPFEMVEKVFKNMTSEGGKFYKMQEIQADTLKGKISNLTDAYQIMFNQIGSSKSGVLKGSVDLLRSMAENYKTVGRIIKDLIVAYGAYKTALVMVKVAEEAALIAGAQRVGTLRATGKAIKILTMESKAYATVQKMISSLNPWAMLAAGAVALIAHLGQLAKAAQQFKGELQQIRDTEFNKAEKSVSNLRDLFVQLQQTNDGSQRRRELIEQLNRVYGEYLPKLVTEKDSLADILSLENQLVNSIRARAKAYATESSFTKLEENYGKDLRSAMRSLMSAVSHIDGIGEKMAEDIVRGFKRKIEQNPDIEAALAPFREVFNEYFGDKAWENLQAEGEGASIMTALNRYAGLLSSYVKEERKIEADIDNRFKESVYSTATERKIEAPIEEEFEKNKRALDNAKKSTDEYNKALNELNISKLEKMRDAYEAINKTLIGTDKEGTWNNKIKQINEQIDALRTKDPGWLQKIVNPLITIDGNNDLTVKEDTKYSEYLDKLRKAYKDVSAEYQDAGKTYRKLSNDKRAGLLIDDAVLEKSKKHYNELQLRKKLIEDIGKALGVSVDDKITGKNRKTQGQIDLESRIDLLKKLQHAYEQLSQFISNKDDIPAHLKNLFSASGVTDDMVKDLNFREQLLEAANQLEKVYGDTAQADKLRNYLGADETSEAIRGLRELAKAQKELAKAREQYSSFVDSWVVGDNVEEDGFAYKLSKMLNDFEIEVEKLENKRDEALNRLQKTANAAAEVRAKQGYGWLEDASEGAVSAARDVISTIAELNGMSLNNFAEMTTDELNEVSAFLNGVNLDDFVENISNGMDAAGLQFTDFKALVERVLADIEDTVERAKIGKKFEIALGNATKKTQNSAKSLAKDYVKDNVGGFDLSNWGHKSLLELLKLKDALKDLENQEDQLANNPGLKEKADKAGVSLDSLIKAIKDAIKGYQDLDDEAAMKKLLKGINRAASALRGMANDMKDLADATGNEGFASFASNLSDAMSTIGDVASALASEDYIGAGVSLMTNLISKIISGIKGIKELELAIANAAIEQKTLNAEIALQRGTKNLWGTDTLQQLINGYEMSAAQFEVAQSDLEKIQRKLSGGKSNDSNGMWTGIGVGGGAGTGALIGLTLGTVVPGIGNAIGAAVGAIVGAIAGAVAGVTADVVLAVDNYSMTLAELAASINAPLMSQELPGVLNKSTLEKILATYDNLDQASKNYINEMIQNLEIYEKAVEQFASAFTDMFGQITAALSDNIVDTFKQAGKAALDYGDIMDDVATTIAKSVIQSNIMKSVFNDDMAKDMAAAVASGNVDNALAILNKGMEQIEMMAPAWTEFLNRLEPYFNMGSGEETGQMSSNIKNITEETADLLSSYINAIRADVAYGKIQREAILAAINSIGEVVPTLADYLNQIAANTYNSSQSTNRILSNINDMMSYDSGRATLRVSM